MTGRPDLTCREFVEVVTDYLESAVPANERRRLEEHLAGCPGCVAYLEQMRATSELAAALGDRSELPPPAVREAMIAAFREWRRGRGQDPLQT